MQNDKRPIGIFDSGLGGLTVMAALTRLLPHEDLIYFGDTAHVPYGSKSREVVTGYSEDIAAFLREQDVKMIVVACNTASAFALEALKSRFDVPILGVIEPGSKAALGVTKSKRIGVIGTQGTIRSASYTGALKRLDTKAKVFGRPCPLFVPLVEEGWLTHPVTLAVAKEYIAPLVKQKIDTLVLGCTHYPLIKKVIRKAAGAKVRLIDSAEATATEVRAILLERGLLNNASRAGRAQFFVSDIPQKFEEVGKRFLGKPIWPVTKINLDAKERR